MKAGTEHWLGTSEYDFDTAAQNTFLNRLTDQQQKTRYPEDIVEFGKHYTKEYAQEVLKKVEEFRKWLLPKIRSAGSSEISSES